VHSRETSTPVKPFISLTEFFFHASTALVSSFEKDNYVAEKSSQLPDDQTDASRKVSRRRQGGHRLAVGGRLGEGRGVCWRGKEREGGQERGGGRIEEGEGLIGDSGSPR